MPNLNIRLFQSKYFIILMLLFIYFSSLKATSKSQIHGNFAINKHITLGRRNFKFLEIRGGVKKDEKYGGKGKKDKKTTEIIENDDDDIDDSDFEIDENEGPKQQNQMVASISDMWIKTPPITQVYVGSSIFLTLFAFALNKNTWPELFNLNWKSVLTKFQLWRPFTAFLFFGPLGLNYILTIQFVWTYMAQLEKLHYNKPEEFFMLLIFGASTLVALYSILGLSVQYLGHNLSTFLVYIWARTFEGTDVNVMDLFNLKAEILPWFFCAQTYLLEGEIPFADFLGIVVGHLYHYIFLEKKIHIIPKFIKDYFESPEIKKKYETFKGDFE